MTEYRVEWEIDIDADSPEEAATKALAIQRNPDSIATVFKVKWRVDRPEYRIPESAVWRWVEVDLA